MMLSGYGLYHSLAKSGSMKRFYFKRGVRILPTYYLFALVYIIFKCMTSQVLFTDILGVLTTMSFWSGQEMVFSWFAQSLIAFYVLSPLMIKLIMSVKCHWWLVPISFVFAFPFVTNGGLFMAMSRIPIFVCGMCFAKSINENGEKWMTEKRYLIHTMGIVGFLMLVFFRFYFQNYIGDIFGKTYYLIFIPALFIVPSLAIIISNSCEVLSRMKFTIIVRLIDIMGTATFEIYLFQSMLYLITLYYIFDDGLSNLMWLLLMSIAIIGGCIISFLIKKSIKHFAVT